MCVIWSGLALCDMGVAWVCEMGVDGGCVRWE